MESPQYKHDCKKCHFLGRFSYQAPRADGSTIPMNVDLYYCEGMLGGTLISRESSDGPDYASTFVSIVREQRHHTEHFAYLQAPIEALNRAEKAGLV